MHLCDPTNCQHKDCTRALKGELTTVHDTPKMAAFDAQKDSRSLNVWVVTVDKEKGALLMKCPDFPLAYAAPVVQQTLLLHAEIADLVNKSSDAGQFLWMILMGDKEHTRHFREQLTPTTDRRVLAEIDYMVKDITLESIRHRLGEMGVF